MQADSNCPDAQALQRFLLGQSTPAEATALEEHLESCESCSASLQTLRADDSMVAALQAGSSTDDATAEEGVQLLANWLKKLRPLDDANAPLSSSANRAELGDTEAFAKSADADNTVSYEFLAPGQDPTELGRLGPYRVRRVLGAGGMGIVFEAYDPDLDRLVALKTMLPNQAAIPAAKKRFLREAKAAAKIKHDHIVTIYQVGEDRDVAFLAMEYLEGESLDQRLRRERRLPLPDVLRIARECAEALAAAHAQGLIHRDIKPGNIWLEMRDERPGTRDENRPADDSPLAPRPSSFAPRVKLLDFGLALPVADKAHLTHTGAIVGTPAFMAPEQLRGQTVDARADLFSLGCVMYRMATGEAAFKGSHAVSTLIAVATTNPLPPQEINPELPPALCELILLLLAKCPNDRPPFASAVVEAIRAIEQARGQNRLPVASVVRSQPAAQEKTTPAPTRHFTRRTWVAAATVLVACVLGWTGYLVWPGNNTTGPIAHAPPVGEPPEEDPANTVNGDGIGLHRVYADPTRGLQGVLEFSDLIGVDAEELSAWRTQLKPGFRLAFVTSRRGNGTTLFNAVAVREKTERLVRFNPQLLSLAALDDDWVRGWDMDRFHLLDQCTYADPNGQDGWAHSRLWIKDEADTGYWPEETVGDVKRTIAKMKSVGLRVRCLEWLPARKARPYQPIVADDHGRKADVGYALGPDELLQVVKRLQHKGLRPDLVTPYWEDNQLRFVLVTVENDDGPDWRFRMNMTAESYRTESEQQRRRGWFPLSLASYGDDADVRYVAIWVPGRAPGTSPPPVEPLDAKAMADRAAMAVSSTSTESKEVYSDGAHNIGEIVDWCELVAATPQELRDWHEKLDSKFRVAFVSGRNGTGETRFNAVALQDKDRQLGRLHIQIPEDMGKQIWDQNHADGYRLLGNCANLDQGVKLPWNFTSIWVKNTNGGRVWYASLRDVANWNRDRKETPESDRTIWIEGKTQADVLRGNTVNANGLGRAWEALYALDHDELLSTIDFYRRKGWRPDVVAPYWVEGKLRSALVVVDNSDKVDWRFRMDMSRADYEKESAQQKNLGLFPLALHSYGHEDAVRYAAIFVRYCRPSKD